ncbi:MAG: hypothetical protein ACRC80_22720 [Waterburya sp.]
MSVSYQGKVYERCPKDTTICSGWDGSDRSKCIEVVKCKALIAQQYRDFLLRNRKDESEAFEGEEVRNNEENQQKTLKEEFIQQFLSGVIIDKRNGQKISIKNPQIRTSLAKLLKSNRK